MNQGSLENMKPPPLRNLALASQIEEALAEFPELRTTTEKAITKTEDRPQIWILMLYLLLCSQLLA